MHINDFSGIRTTLNGSLHQNQLHPKGHQSAPKPATLHQSLKLEQLL